jgi:hypothetical protein
MPILHKSLLLALSLASVSCQSVDALKKGDVFGAVIGAPFEIANGALQTAVMPIGGGKPQWVRDAQISNMSLDKPKLNDPAWTKKFSHELATGNVYLATFDENIKAYELTKAEKYLSHAEQLATTEDEKQQLELVALTALGQKAFDTKITINGQTTSPKYDSQQSKVLFIGTTINGATVHPRGNATLSLRSDLPFALRGSYNITVAFTFTIPRESTAFILGMSSKSDSPSTGRVTKTFNFGPGKRSASCDLDFGEINGANTGAAMGGTVIRRVTGSPYTSFEIQKIARS